MNNYPLLADIALRIILITPIVALLYIGNIVCKNYYAKEKLFIFSVREKKDIFQGIFIFVLSSIFYLFFK